MSSSLPRLAVLLALAVQGLPCPTLAREAASERVDFALMPLKRGVRDQAAIAAVETALELQLASLGKLAAPEATRRVLRRLRLRDVDAAPPASLHRLAGELGTRWLVVATLHDVPRHVVPDLAVSIRFYAGDSGELVWAGFLGRSGLDGRRLLGLGVVDRMETLAPEAVRRLLAEAPILDGGGGRSRAPDRRGATPGAEGRLAVVPFTSYVEQDAQPVADAATEAATAVLVRFGAELASPGCVRDAMRRQKARAWGEIAAATRAELRTSCGAHRLLTGAVERWDLAGSGLEPEPLIALSLRLLDAETGGILWMGSREAGGWDRESVLGIGRVFSRGALLGRLLGSLARELARGDHLEPGSGPLEG